MAITPLPTPPEVTDTPQEFNTKAFAWVDALDTFVTEANAQATDVNNDAQLAEDWASKTDGQVATTDYSAKAWAVGGTGVTDTSSRGAAKEWATETASTVDGTEYSAKEYAVGTQTRGTTGSAKDWATYTSGTVDGSEYSAKYHAEAASTSATQASASANAAFATANVTEWSSGATYAAGDNVYSPTDFQTYRNTTGTNTATDPSSDATNWERLGGSPPGGSDTQIQYNNAGSFGGASGLVTDGSNLTINAQGDLRFADSDSSNWVALQAPATIASNVTWTLPDADGTDGQVMKTNGSGTLSWITPSTGGGGGGTSVTVTQATATASQTTFNVTYTVGQLSVYLNGALLASADYTATNGTTVVLAAGAASGDIFTALAYDSATQITVGDSSVEVTDTGSDGTATFTLDNTVRAKVNQYGIGLGTETPSSGMGIKFPVTQSASTDANTLDDYEEGTFSPTLTGDGFTRTLNAQYTGARYVKIGRVVTYSVTMLVTSQTGTYNSGTAYFNLPFTAQNVTTSMSWNQTLCRMTAVPNNTPISKLCTVQLNNNNLNGLAFMYYDNGGTSTDTPIDTTGWSSYQIGFTVTYKADT